MVRTRPNSIRTIRLNSWKQYLELIINEPYRNWAFRGQKDASTPLLTSLSRYLTTFKVDPRAWRTQEERILRIFKRKAHNYLQHIPAGDDHFEWLALMEHHGAPTRLLDLTWSPYVAAFFALEKATDEAAVWAFNPREILRVQKDGSGRRLQPRNVDPRQPENFARCFLHGAHPFIWIGEPETMNRRLTAQSGTFLMPSVLDRSVDAILTGQGRGQELILRILLPAASVRAQGLRELYSMNITHATLFPDLDGLGRSLAYEVEFHWAYDPHTMQSFFRAGRAKR